MISVQLKRDLPFTPSDLVMMVADVEKYPEFLPYIKAVRIVSRKQVDDTCFSFIADVHLQYKMFSEVFHSEVVVNQKTNVLTISRSGRGGALRSLSNVWKFSPHEAGTHLNFDLSVALKMSPLEFIVKQKIDRAIDKIMTAFEQRAHEKLPSIKTP